MLLFICNLKLSIGSRLYQVKVTPSAPQNKSMLFTASTAIWPLSKHPFMPLLRRREMFRSTPHPTCERKDWKEGKKGRMEGEGERKEYSKNLSYLPEVSWLVNEESGLNPAWLDLKVHSFISTIASLLGLLPAQGLCCSHLHQWLSAL